MLHRAGNRCQIPSRIIFPDMPGARRHQTVFRDPDRAALEIDEAVKVSGGLAADCDAQDIEADRTCLDQHRVLLIKHRGLNRVKTA